MPPVIVKFPSEWTESSAVFKLKVPPEIVIDISVVSFVDTFIPFALYKSLSKLLAFAPSLKVFILKVPPFITSLSLAWIPSLKELILKIPPFIVTLPLLSVSP